MFRILLVEVQLPQPTHQLAEHIGGCLDVMTDQSGLETPGSQANHHAAQAMRTGYLAHPLRSQTEQTYQPALCDGRSLSNVRPAHQVANLQLDEITTFQVMIDGQLKKRSITNALFSIK